MLEYTARKDKPDYATHGFGYMHHFDTLIVPQFSEFNNAYKTLMILKTTLHITISLKTYQIKDKHSAGKDSYYPRQPELSYLWHQTHEANEVASKLV
jgi:hypothetical protein